MTAIDVKGRLDGVDQSVNFISTVGPFRECAITGDAKHTH